MSWFVYIVRCADESLYTGITVDVARRVAEHNTGKKAARYTSVRRPVELVYCEAAADRAAASRREYAIKQLSAYEKQNLCQNHAKKAE